MAVDETAETRTPPDDGAPPSSSSFAAIPTLALRDARSPATKPRFLAALRAALLDVGFLYLDVTGEAALPARLLADAVAEGVGFFAADRLPDAEKRRIEMKNEKSFLGWSRVVK
ncbi:hypothetical protein SLS58_002545 [Diplodia intermedia]|uniref:Non-haem dioxygenase N-terminal domain-containing protein n=1 Tax=Diplodia intermedia TaxID=856260 RepID=A0ABR3TYS3_9PEZI